jgi:hypothetical protein
MKIDILLRILHQELWAMKEATQTKLLLSEIWILRRICGCSMSLNENCRIKQTVK